MADGQGLPTTSTTAAYNTIASMSAGTTTGLSAIVLPAPPPSTENRIYLPIIVR